MSVVLRITPVLDFGGIEKRLVNTAKLGDEQVEFVFVALGRGGWAEQEILRLRKDVIVLNSSFAIPSFALVLKLVRLIRRLKPDVVHTSSAEANFHGVIAARICGIRIVVAEEVGFPSHGAIARLVFKTIYSMSNTVIAISDAVRLKLIELEEVSLSKCIVVYNPVSIPELTVMQVKEDVVNLLMVCRLEPVKNIEAVLIFLANYSRDKARIELTIVGEGSTRKHLERMARELSVSDIVTFAGFAADASTFYQRADIFLLPSFSEGLSNSLLEAMAWGLLCVATKVGGPAEIITHGVNGFLVDPGSEQDIEHTFATVVVMSRKERERIGMNGRNAVIDRFSNAKYVSSLKKVYRII